jgi:hypothetical protein
MVVLIRARVAATAARIMSARRTMKETNVWRGDGEGMAVKNAEKPISYGTTPLCRILKVQ